MVSWYSVKIQFIVYDVVIFIFIKYLQSLHYPRREMTVVPLSRFRWDWESLWGVSGLVSQLIVRCRVVIDNVARKCLKVVNVGIKEANTQERALGQATIHSSHCRKSPPNLYRHLSVCEK